MILIYEHLTGACVDVEVIELNFDLVSIKTTNKRSKNGTKNRAVAAEEKIVSTCRARISISLLSYLKKKVPARKRTCSQDWTELENGYRCNEPCITFMFFERLFTRSEANWTMNGKKSFTNDKSFHFQCGNS